MCVYWSALLFNPISSFPVLNPVKLYNTKVGWGKNKWFKSYQSKCGLGLHHPGQKEPRGNITWPMGLAVQLIFQMKYLTRGWAVRMSKSWRSPHVTDFATCFSVILRSTTMAKGRSFYIDIINTVFFFEIL